MDVFTAREAQIFVGFGESESIRDWVGLFRFAFTHALAAFMPLACPSYE